MRTAHTHVNTVVIKQGSNRLLSSGKNPFHSCPPIVTDVKGEERTPPVNTQTKPEWRGRSSSHKTKERDYAVKNSERMSAFRTRSGKWLRRREA